MIKKYQKNDMSTEKRQKIIDDLRLICNIRMVYQK